MLAHVEASRVGLSGASKIGRSPRPLVLKVIEENPGVSKEEAFELFRTALKQGRDPEYQRAMEFYFFLHMWDYAVGPSTRSRPDPIQRVEMKERQNEEVERVKAQIVMLDLTMPNGKPMKECTGAEMAKFGNRFQKIAERVGKNKTVGSVLSEDQVKGIMR